MVAAALTAAASSLVVLTVGGAANLVAKPLESRTWLPGGGFIGAVNRPAPQPVDSPISSPSSEGNGVVASGKKIHPIGGQTDKDSPPSPFGRFPKHKPTKLPGPPKPYVPSESP